MIRVRHNPGERAADVPSRAEARLVVVHLLDPARTRDTDGVGEEGLAIASALVRARAAAGDIRIEHQVWLVGDAGSELVCAAFGLHSTDRVGLGPGSARGLARLAAQRTLAAHATVVQCYSGRAAALAARALGGTRAGAVPIAEVRSRLPSEHRAIPGMVIVALTSSVRASAEARGEDVRSLPLPVTRDAVGFRHTASRSDARRELGLDPAQTLVVPLGGPGALIDARRFTFLLGLLRASGIDATGLLPAGASDARSVRFWRHQQFGGRLIRVGESVAPWLGVADVGVWDGVRETVEGCLDGVWWLRTADALGMRIVAPDGPTARASLREDHFRCLAVNSSVSELAGRVLEALRPEPPQPLAPARGTDGLHHEGWRAFWAELAHAPAGLAT
ncbi:MAG: hypothetical protein JNM07_06870 [Phycisphaerae bacterium]|nr:hypothetical protein [Phycisphaerae bacterium]